MLARAVASLLFSAFILACSKPSPPSATPDPSTVAVSAPTIISPAASSSKINLPPPPPPSSTTTTIASSPPATLPQLPALPKNASSSTSKPCNPTCFYNGMCLALGAGDLKYPPGTKSADYSDLCCGGEQDSFQEECRTMHRNNPNYENGYGVFRRAAFGDLCRVPNPARYENAEYYAPDTDHLWDENGKDLGPRPKNTPVPCTDTGAKNLAH